MKKFIQVVVLLLILILTIKYQKEISNYIIFNFIYKREIVIEDSNQYKLDFNFQYLKETDNFIPRNKKELINIIYTILNNGWSNFTFYCDPKYTTCIEDIEELSQDSSFLSILNNFIHPFNTYSTLYTNYSTFGRITIEVDKTYSRSEIELLEKKVDEIYNAVVKDNMSTVEKIKAIHDYIINTTSYDSDRSDAIISKNYDYIPLYQSHKAVGPLLQNKAICGGYSDAMALFLIKMDIPNYKISNQDHIWNYVNLDDQWYHLDLTWDDPTLENGEELLIHDYFLLTTEELFAKNNNHQFKEVIFLEAALKGTY
ncbi:MAG: hypothetical protein GX190_02115 [Mollicutes bacterium]|nr:hypothetical protein [Mollicutes bacterium]